MSMHDELTYNSEAPAVAAVPPPAEVLSRPAVAAVSNTGISTRTIEDGYRSLVEFLVTLPPNKLVNIPLSTALSVTLSRFRHNLLSTAEAMVPPVKLRTRRNEDRTGLVVWREDDQIAATTLGQSRCRGRRPTCDRTRRAAAIAAPRESFQFR